MGEIDRSRKPENRIMKHSKSSSKLNKIAIRPSSVGISDDRNAVQPFYSPADTPEAQPYMLNDEETQIYADCGENWRPYSDTSKTTKLTGVIAGFKAAEE